IVTERPKVTAAALALIVRLGLGLVGFGGLAARAGPAQAKASASTALSFLMYLKRAKRARGWRILQLSAGCACGRRAARSARVGRVCLRLGVLELLPVAGGLVLLLLP